MRHVVGFGLAATFLLLAGVQISFHGILSGRQQERADGAQAKKTVQDASELMRKASAMMEEAEQRSAQADRVSSELKKLQEKLAQKEEELRAQGMKAANSDANMDDGSSGGEKEGKAEVQPEKDVAGKESVHNASALFDPATMISSVPLEDALHLHRTKLDEKIEDNCHDNPDYQSSKHFVNFEAPSMGGWSPPSSVDKGRGSCDPTNFSPTAEERGACDAFMRDFRNWARVRPMTSRLNTGRTIKFQVETVDPDVHLVMKIPQKKFTLEPQSEVVAFLLDKELGLGRIPSVALVPVPVDWLRAAAAVFMPAMYNQWLDCYVLNHEAIQGMVRKGDGTTTTLQVSVQVFMKGVRPVHKTPLKLLTKLGMKLDERLDPASFEPESKLEAWAFAEACDQYVFDHLTANTDRGESFANMHNVFAAGDCETPPWGCDGKSGTEFPRLVWLDQGSAFYKASRHGVATSHFKKESKICRFSARMHKILSETNASHLEDAVLRQLPEGFFAVGISEDSVQSAFKRFSRLQSHFKHCAEHFKPEQLVVGPELLNP